VKIGNIGRGIGRGAEKGIILIARGEDPAGLKKETYHRGWSNPRHLPGRQETARGAPEGLTAGVENGLGAGF